MSQQPLIIHNATVPTNALAPTFNLGPEHPAYTTVDITIANGQIEKILPTEHVSARSSNQEQLLDATGCTLLPGFVDVHVHGGAGHDTMDATPEALVEMARFFARHGVTSFLPTTITAPHEEILRAVANVATTLAAFTDQPWPGARILGLHIEGPYISPHYPGAQPVDFIRPPNLDEFAELIAAGPVRMITLAPEEAGAEALIALARRHDVTVVWGHTDATYETCLWAAEQGITQATHTYNAMSGLHHRRPGVLGATLTIDSIYAQLIADNIHVHPAAMQVLARCKGVDRTILITDAMRAAGLPDGGYDLGGQMVTVAEGACRLANGTLAGSILTMESALANFLAATAMSLAEGWPVTSRTALRSLTGSHAVGNGGTIARGKIADLVLLDERLTVVTTIRDGVIVYV